jgi:hypothetical protein
MQYWIKRGAVREAKEVKPHIWEAFLECCEHHKMPYSVIECFVNDVSYGKLLWIRLSKEEFYRIIHSGQSYSRYRVGLPSRT